MKKTMLGLTGLIAAYIISTNISCNIDKGKEATWENEKVSIAATESTKTEPRYINYAIKTGSSDMSLVVMNDNNIYLRQSGSGVWTQFKGGYEKVHEIMQGSGGRYTHMGVMNKDTLYTVTDKNLLLGLEGIGGYEPISR